MQTPRTGDAVEIEVRVAARPETVFPFFTEPEKAMRWMGVTADLEPRPGGLYRVNITGGDIVRGAFVEVVPHSRVVFTWGWEAEGHAVAPGASTVEVTLTPDGNGTIVRLRHSGLSPEQGEQHAYGWQHYLARLVIAGAGGDAGVDPWTSPGGEEMPST